MEVGLLGPLSLSDNGSAPPEVLAGEGPTIASDIYALGVMLAEAATGHAFDLGSPQDSNVAEVVRVATSANPADRYPDASAFVAALRDAIGTTETPAPRSVRRNPYKGLAAFDEHDNADFYGRDDVIESILGNVAATGLTAVIGASGSGKSSVILAGVVPELRAGALLGSDEWSIVYMVPGTDPFDEFHVALRDAAVAYESQPAQHGGELASAFDAALDGPQTKALLIVDQFEEVFSSELASDVRARFLDSLVELASDPAHRVRVVLTLRADFADRPLAHPGFGALISDSHVLLAPMRPDQVEDVIRQPAGRVGVQVEPGLVSEIVRDVSSAPAYLPLLQYVLAELFERRTEDRLTVSAYRLLGGVEGVLERRAEATFRAVSPPGQQACRQLFLRMIHLGDHGEETRRRLPLDELEGLGGRETVDEALEAFGAARILTYDRDPVSRTPTVEVAHETVIRRWSRYRVWIDEARSDVLAHRRLAAATRSWADSGEDPQFLLTGGPLSSADELVAGGRITLNDIEARFLEDSRLAAADQKQAEDERRRHESEVEERSERRLRIGVGAVVIAIVVGVLAVFAVIQRQRANDLAATQERQNTARELAAASISSLTSADADLALLLAIAGADQALEAGEPILHQVVDALHRAVINPRPDLVIEGVHGGIGGRLVEYSDDGTFVAALASEGGAVVVDTSDGSELGRVSMAGGPALALDLHADQQQVLTIHPDGARQWDWRTSELQSFIGHPVEVATGAYSPDGRHIAVGDQDGAVHIFDSTTGETVAELTGQHSARVVSLDFSPEGERLVSAAFDSQILIWDIASATATEVEEAPVLPVWQVSWHPTQELIAVSITINELFLLDAETGNRVRAYGNGANGSRGFDFDPLGRLLVGAGDDGFTRIFGTFIGGEASITLPGGGVPTHDAALGPTGLTVATVGLDGRLRIWSNILSSELEARPSLYLGAFVVGSADGTRYLFGANALGFGLPEFWTPNVQVIESGTGEVIATYRTRSAVAGPIAAISADGSHIAAPGPIGGVQVSDIDNRTFVPLNRSHAVTGSMSFSTDEQFLAGGGTDGSVTIWDADTGDVVIALEGHGDRAPPNGGALSNDPSDAGLGFASSFTTSRVEQVAFAPSGHRIASIGSDGTVRLWDLESATGRVLHQFDYIGISVAWSSNGELLAASDRSGSIVVIDAGSGSIVLEPESVPGGSDLTFSPDGQFLAGAGPARNSYLWDLSTGRIVRTFEGAVYHATSVAFINDGSQIRVASTEGFDRGYLLDPLDLLELARSEVTRQLTDEECVEYLYRLCSA